MSSPADACPLCSDPSLEARVAELQTMGQPDSKVAVQCGVTVDQLRAHTLGCVPAAQAAAAAQAAEVASSQDGLPQPAAPGVVDGGTIIARLQEYLRQVETIISSNPDPADVRTTLMALDQARKTCETMAKLYLEIMQAQLDASVQAEFRRIVLEAINAADPATRQRIVDEITARAALFGALGGPGL